MAEQNIRYGDYMKSAVYNVIDYLKMCLPGWLFIFPVLGRSLEIKSKKFKDKLVLYFVHLYIKSICITLINLNPHRPGGGLFPPNFKITISRKI